MRSLLKDKVRLIVGVLPQLQIQHFPSKSDCNTGHASSRFNQTHTQTTVCQLVNKCMLLNFFNPYLRVFYLNQLTFIAKRNGGGDLIQMEIKQLLNLQTDFFQSSQRVCGNGYYCSYKLPGIEGDRQINTIDYIGREKSRNTSYTWAHWLSFSQVCIPLQPTLTAVQTAVTDTRSSLQSKSCL